MKKPWLFAVATCCLGLLVAAHIFFFLHLPSSVALGSGVGIVAGLLLIKLALVRMGIHKFLRRIH